MTSHFWQNKLLNLLLTFVGVFLFLNQAAKAQTQPALDDIQQIVALVNDDVITLYDLKQRSLLMMLSSRENLVTQEAQRALQSRAMDALIDDKLKMQEAIEYESNVEETVLDQAYSNYATQFNLSPEDLEEQLRLSGVIKPSLIAQINGTLSWQRVVQGLLEPQVNITDDEVFNSIETLEKNKGKDEYRISEIFLLTTDNEKRAEALTTANAIYEQLTQNVPFSAMAQQFSQSSTAAVGGDMGWVFEGELPSEVKDKIITMQRDEISEPVQTTDGIYILQVTDKRKILTVTEDDTIISTKFILFEKPEDSPETTDEYLANINQTITSNADSLDFCEVNEDVLKSIGGAASGDMGDVEAGRFKGDVKGEVLALEVGKATKLYEDEDVYRAYIVCGKRIPEVNLPDFDTVLASMTSTRLQLFARRHLRDLRRDAIIDYK
ncbi:MAG: peptidylprolyl isomerase [Emcibacteraceae bacterium]|nr:peptidylprolyl isomerase [Emcibacteraceae bacterium]